MILDEIGYLKYLEDIFSLFEVSFKRKGQREYFKWRYIDNPQKNILVNVFLDGRVVANYSASPCIMNVYGQKVKTALSMTTMTHPKYTGRGLFIQLAKQLYEYMQQQGFAMVWGFPNYQSHYTFVSKLQWKDVYEIPTMRLVFNSKCKDVVEFVTDDVFQLNYDNSKNSSDFIHVVKDKTYLQWRYAQNPLNHYTNFVIADKGKVSSFAVVKQYEKQLDLVDFQVKDKEEGIQLMRQLFGYVSEYKLEAINCWAPRHHFMHGICEKLGFTNSAPVTYLGARQFVSSDFRENINMDYSNWFIQMGDSDVY